MDYVVDGDTFILADRRHVRLIGINSPERGKNGTPDEPLAQAARRGLEQLVGGQTVRLVIGRAPQDRYGRLLAHVWLADGRSAQQELLARGLAVVIAIPPNLSRLDAYQKAERVARAHRIGVWAHPYYEPIDAKHVQSKHTGFRLVVAQVRNISRSRNYIYLRLSGALTLMVPRKDWSYFKGRPEDFVGKQVSVRGWVRRHDDGLQIRVRHPAMLKLLN